MLDGRERHRYRCCGAGHCARHLPPLSAREKRYSADAPQELVRMLLKRAEEVHLAVRHGVTLDEHAVAAAEDTLAEFERWYAERNER